MRKIKIGDVVRGNHRAGFRRGCGGMLVVGYRDNSSVWVEAAPLSGRAFMYDYELDIEVPVNEIGEIE